MEVELSQANRALISGAYDAFARGDLQSVLAVLDRNVEWTDAEGFPYAGTYFGRDAVKEKIFARIQTEWNQFDVRANAYVADSERVVALGEYRATYKFTDLDLVAPFAHVWEIKNGRVVRFRQFTDAPPFQRAVKRT